MAPQVGLESASAKATAGQAYPPSLRNRWLDLGCEATARPPVNSRVTVVLLVAAGSCCRLPERALLQQSPQVAHMPDRAASCCDLPRVVARKGQEKGDVVAGGSEVQSVSLVGRG